MTIIVIIFIIFIVYLFAVDKKIVSHSLEKKRGKTITFKTLSKFQELSFKNVK